MSKVLKGPINEKCMMYLDDVLVIGRKFKDHLDKIREVFQRLREANLSLKPKKCHFAKQQVLYLGYVVSEAGISADKSKVEAVLCMAIHVMCVLITKHSRHYSISHTHLKS